MSSHFIRREEPHPNSTSSAPWSGLSFVYDIESDELADSLRVAFPLYGNLRERKHAAVISFFASELDSMRKKNAADAPMRTSKDYHLAQVSPQTSDTQMDVGETESIRESNIPPSPVNSIKSPGYRDSVIHCPATQPVSSLSFAADPTLAAASTHLVFNAFDGRPVQQKTKRKMTTEERLDYRRTRQRGACAKCKRQKEKVGATRFMWELSDSSQCTHMTGALSPSNDTTEMTESFQR